MSITSVRIQTELEKPLEDLSGKLHRSKNWLINEAVREFIAKHELESEKWRQTLEAVESVKSGNIVDGKEVHTWVKSWGKKSEGKPPKI